MSIRREIKDGALFDVLDRGIVYTEALGWLDMGHAVAMTWQRSNVNSLRESVAVSHLIPSCIGKIWAS